MLEHASRQDRDSVAAHRRGGADEIGTAEDEQGLNVQVGDSFEQLLLGVGLFEHLRIDVVDRNVSTVALGLDREDPAWPNEYVIDVAAAQRDVVDDMPSIDFQLGADRADSSLSRRAAEPAVGLVRVEAVGAHHRPDRSQLEDDERDAA